LVLKIGVNGYGVIGKRIVDALMKMPWARVIGIVKTKPDYTVKYALSRGLKIYTLRENSRLFIDNNIPIEGYVEDLIEESDIVIDATPGGYGRRYLELYKSKGKPAVFQGGEKPDVAELSFNSICNYEEAYGKRYVRVVSCNTTGLLRIICLLDFEFGVRKVRATIIRRGADPREDERGPINSIRLDYKSVPSHHALDVKTILPNLDIVTTAYIVPTTLMHLHSLIIETRERVSVDRLIDTLNRVKRIILVDPEKTGIYSTSGLIEFARDTGRFRYDIPENIVWLNSIYVNGNEILLSQAIHQESIVIPENIDAVKSMTGIELDKWKAIDETDQALGLGDLKKYV